MVSRAPLSRIEPGFTMPAFERLAPPPSPTSLIARLEASTAPGDIVADLFGRGGWTARAAIDRQRRGITIESSPLTRLLAEVVLRPPDLRHLDAAFSTLSSSPRGDSSLKLSIGSTFATRCATCDRSLIADEFTWTNDGQVFVLARKAYRCSVCRDQRGGLEQRQVEVDESDLQRAAADVGGAAARDILRARFPVTAGAETLPDALLDLHTERQLVGLAAILERIENDLRAAPVESALRLAFLHTVLPASRLGMGPGRLPGIRIAGGVVRSPIPESVRERNPWLAFEEGFRIVRAFVQRIEGGAIGPLDARLGTDLRSLADGSATAIVRTVAPNALAGLVPDDDAFRERPRTDIPPRIRLLLGQPPIRYSQERLAAAYHGTCWALGREAASVLPLEPLLGAAIRAPWSWQSAVLRGALEEAAPLMARDGRAVLMLEGGGPEALVAVVLAGVGAGYRLADCRLAEPGEEFGGSVEFIPPGAKLPPGPRTRAGRSLDPVPGGSGDPEMVPGPGLFSPPERVGARPFSLSEAARTVTDTAVEVLRERGEPGRHEHLLGEILVALDRAGHLRRLVLLADAEAADLDGHSAASGQAGAVGPEAAGPGAVGPGAVGSGAVGSGAAGPGGNVAPAGASSRARPSPPGVGPIDRVLSLVGDELGRASQQRLREIAPGQWWLESRADREGAAVPLADRVEWAVYSLLSTAGPFDEPSFFGRIASLFSGHDLPDEALVRACLASYMSTTATPEHLVTGDDVRHRTAEHTELLARLADGGHRLGMHVWIGQREQARRFGAGTLGDLLERQEQTAWLPAITRASAEDLQDVDCIWYVRNKTALLFEVEWTAMLGDVLLRRHSRIAANDQLVRFLVIAPERAALVQYKLDASPVLQQAIETDNWHLVLWPQLQAWLAHDPLDLTGLEPYLGLDHAPGRKGEQLDLFPRPDALP